MALFSLVWRGAQFLLWHELRGSHGHATVDLQDKLSGKLAVVYGYEHAWIDSLVAHSKLVDVIVGICEIPMKTIFWDSIQGLHDL